MTARRGLFLFSFLMVLLCLMPAGRAETLNVPGAAYPDIASALRQAADGDIIKVAHGGYRENLVIGGDNLDGGKVTLFSNPGAKIKGSITVQNAVLELDGFEVRRTKSTSGPDGIVLQNAHGSIIRNSYIHGFTGRGIVIEGSDQVLIEDNAICGTNRGIVCSNSQGTVIQYNSITRNSEFGVFNATEDPEYVVDAASNWWGDATGPGGTAGGFGDAVSDGVTYADWDDATDQPTVEIIRAYASGFSDRTTIYRGDFVDYTVEYMITGGSIYGKYVVKAVALSDFGYSCTFNRTKTKSKTVAGPGLHTITFRKKVPSCADIKTYGVSVAGIPFEMDGHWVDLLYRITLFEPCGNNIVTDGWKEASVYLVKRRP